MGPHPAARLAFTFYAALDRPAPELSPTPIVGVYRDPSGLIVVRHQGRVGPVDPGARARAIERVRVEILGGVPGHPLARP